jgi:hypothetical protein
LAVPACCCWQGTRRQRISARFNQPRASTASPASTDFPPRFPACCASACTRPRWPRQPFSCFPFVVPRRPSWSRSRCSAATCRALPCTSARLPQPKRLLTNGSLSDSDLTLTNAQPIRDITGIGTRSIMKKLSVLVCMLLGWVLPGWAQQAGSAAPCCDAIEQHLKDMEDRIILLEGQVRILKEQLAQAQSAQPSQAQATGAASGAETSGTAAAAGTSGGQATPTAIGEGGTQLPN